MRNNKPKKPEMRMYSLKEIMEVGEMQERESWPANEALAQSEYDYRRGYRDGWMEAHETLYWLMIDKHLSRDDAYALSAKHVNKTLQEWKEAAETTVLGHTLLTSTHSDGTYPDGDWPPDITEQDIETQRRRANGQ